MKLPAGGRSGGRCPASPFISLMLFCVTFAVFSRVLVADFVQWDDDISVYQNPHMQGLDWGRLRGCLATPATRYATSRSRG